MLGIRNDYSWAEGVLSFWATLILIVLAVTSLGVRYVTTPLSCFLPAQFEASQVDYSNKYCFHSSSIFSPDVPLDDGAQDSPYGHSSRFTYHQWLPFFLGVAATLCLLSHVTWRMFSSFLWLDAHELVQNIASNQQQSTAGRHVMLRDCALLLQAGFKGGNSMLAMAAMSRKALGCVVCFVQMLLMLLVFAPQLDYQTDATEDGFLENVNASIPLPVNPFSCYFPIRQIQNMHQYTAMCFMPLAQVYSKGLVFLVYFFLVLFLLCVLDLTLWTMRLAMPRIKDMALQRFLSIPNQLEGRPQGSNAAHVSRFLETLGLDGRLLLALVADCCGALAAADLTNHLWQVFKDSPHPAPASSTVETSGAASGSPMTSPGAGESGGDTGAIPMITISDKDGDTAAQDDEKGKVC